MSYPYKREAASEVRVYNPRAGKYPNATCAAYIGKPVEVMWRSPIPYLAGCTPNMEHLFEFEWVAWVPILGCHIPESDFQKQFKGPL